MKNDSISCLPIGYRQLFLFFLFVTFLSLSGRAQRIISRPLPFYYQLPSNEISDIYQDREGYIWLGTTNGVARYDGYRVRYFRSDYQDMDKLTNNAILSITDNGRYVWLGTRGGLNLYDKQTHRINSFADKALQGKVINHMATGLDDCVWIASGSSVFRSDPKGEKLKRYELASDSVKNFVVNGVYVDKAGAVWALSNNGLWEYNAVRDTFTSRPPLGYSNNLHRLYQDREGRYWIGTWGEGLWRFYPERAEGCYVRQPLTNEKNGKEEPTVFSLVQDDTYGYLWLLSYNALYALDCTVEGVPKPVNLHGIVDTDRMYTKLLKDREGNLWIGSYDLAYMVCFDRSGINYRSLSQLREQTGHDANLLNLCMDNKGWLWMWQDRYGLCLYDAENDNLMADVNQTDWLEFIMRAEYGEGVWLYPAWSEEVLRMTHKGTDVQVMERIKVPDAIRKAGTIDDLAEDADGNLWARVRTGMYVRKSGANELIEADCAIRDVTALTTDADGQVWVVTVDGDLYDLRVVNGQVVARLRNRTEGLAPSETAEHLCIDDNGQAWIVTSMRRVFRSNQEGEILGCLELEEHVGDGSILGLLAEKDNVWIVTNKKALCYDIRRKAYREYDTTDENIGVRLFRYRAFCTDGKGGLYVGGYLGVVHLPADETTGQGKACQPRITDVRVDGRSVWFDGKAETDNRESVTLEADARNIELCFSTLQYAPDKRIRMAYKLEGVDHAWTYLDYGESTAFYNQLKKGIYTLHLKTEYGQGEWSNDEIVLTLIRQPAFYETGWALVVYALLVVGMVVWILLSYTNRLKRRSERQLKEEMTRAKLRYFTNVSHELLTPLTVIRCVAENIEESHTDLRKPCDVLLSNADKLKRLIKQVLDFRKIDVGKMGLNVSKGDISSFIRVLCLTNFAPLAERKDINLKVEAENGLEGWLDFDKLDQIVYNLLSNALKYTLRGQHISVQVRSLQKEGIRWLVLEVADNGIGIEPKELGRIFTRFYQGKNNQGVESNGIGLSLTKSLVEMHRGAINVDSSPNKGTCFTVEIPIDKEVYSKEEQSERATEETSEKVDTSNVEPQASGNNPVLLLVDDNVELLSTIKESLGRDYTIETATDGAQAWNKLNACEVDLIVCDVMLPDVNGWKLCARIKGDLRYSHIPILILTAKTQPEDQIASYDAGADGYITKPFSIRVLRSRADNLIKAAHKRQEDFRKVEDVNVDALSYPKADKQFLQDLIHHIERHLEEQEFDIPALSREMNMSKSTLYRKLKSMTGLVPKDFVRNVKMKRACMMLAEGRMTVSEVAYAIGFSNPKYFTKSFKEEFGVTPTEYCEKLKGKR